MQEPEQPDRQGIMAQCRLGDPTAFLTDISSGLQGFPGSLLGQPGADGPHCIHVGLSRLDLGNAGSQGAGLPGSGISAPELS